MIINPIKLSDCITLAKGKPPKEIPYFGLGAEPYLNPDYLRGNGQVEYAKGAINSVRVFDGETVLLWDGSNAGEVFRGRKGLLASTMSHVKHSEEFDLNYFYYAVKHFEPFLKGQTSGSGIPHVDKEIFGKLELLVFSTNEQQQIAKILSTLDQAIEQTEAIIAKQQRIKTGLMQDLLTKGIDEKGNIRSESTHEFKDSALGRIPVEWDAKTISDSAEIYNNLRKPLSAQVRENMKGEYPYYGPTGIFDYINEYRINGKYVLIGEDGDHFLKFGKQEMTILVNGLFNVNNHAHLLQGKNGVLTEWLHFYFMHHDITYFLTRQGAGRYKLNKSTLLVLPLAFPNSNAEQMRILDVIRSFRDNYAVYQLQLDKFKTLKNGLMHDLLTGKVRVTNIQTPTLTPEYL